MQAVRFVDLSEIQRMIEKKEIVDRPEVYQILFKYLFRF